MLAWGLAVTLILPAAARAAGGDPADASDAGPAARAARPERAVSGARETASRATGPAQPGLAAAPAARGARLPTAGRVTAWRGSAVAAPAARGARLPTAAERAVPAPATRNAQRRAASSRPDFLFGRPRVSVGVHGLWHRAQAGSDFYDEVDERLFVRRSDTDDPKNPGHGLLNFNAPGVGFDFGFGVTSRLDVRFGLGYAKSLNESELRGFIGSDGLPFEQRTELSQVDVRGEVAFALAPRGRAIGQYAWVPARVVPYVGAGFGFVRYDLRQIGEFVDPTSFEIFEEAYTSKGWGRGVHVFGGADVRMTRHVFLNAEARQVRAAAGLGEVFSGFEPLDLGGLRVAAGVRFVF